MSECPYKPGDIVSHHQMCGFERAQLQRGMNFRLHNLRSIFLMSQRPNAPYQDEVLDGGKTLIYEGHDLPNYKDGPDPKTVDQPLTTPNGKPTQNGLFFQAAEERGHTESYERVYVYEKIKPGIWVYNGAFALRSAEIDNDGIREVCKFRLELLDEVTHSIHEVDLDHTRMIPSEVKQQVWKRDNGRCTQCGSEDNLHFDHIIPFSKGGSSLDEKNIQLLCARHNLTKSDKIV